MKCQHDNCDNEATECFLPDNDGEKPDYYYCSTHAASHGFCYGCGGFWGGVESFDLARSGGGVHVLCEDCAERFKFEDDENDEDFEEYESPYA